MPRPSESLKAHYLLATSSDHILSVGPYLVGAGATMHFVYDSRTAGGTNKVVSCAPVNGVASYRIDIVGFDDPISACAAVEHVRTPVAQHIVLALSSVETILVFVVRPIGIAKEQLVIPALHHVVSCAAVDGVVPLATFQTAAVRCDIVPTPTVEHIITP